jgi:hypothetical protein
MIRIVNPVTTSGYYLTTDGRFAHVGWRNGQTRISHVVRTAPTPEQERVLDVGPRSTKSENEAADALWALLGYERVTE